MSRHPFLSRWPGHEELVASLIEEMIAGEKTWTSAVMILVIAVILSVAAYLNTTLWGIHWVVMTCAVIPPTLIEFVSCHYFKKHGALHPTHLLWDDIEDACVTGCFAVLLIAYGTALSPLWFIIAANLVGHAKRPHQPFLIRVQVFVFSSLITYFLWISRPADAAIVLLLGGVSLWVIKVTRDAQVGIFSAEIKRVETQRALHTARVEAERSRLSQAIESGLAREMEHMLVQIESIPEPPESLREIVDQTSRNFESLRSLVDSLRDASSDDGTTKYSPSDEQLETELTSLIHSHHEERIRKLRSWKNTAAFWFLGIIMVAIYQLPDVRTSLGVDPETLYAVIVSSVLATTIPTWTLGRIDPLHPAQLWLDRIEGVTIFGAGLVLIFFSGEATSVFWFVIIAQILNIRQSVLALRYFIALHAIGYVALALAFWILNQSLSDFAITLALGGTALWVLQASGRTNLNRLHLIAQSNLLLRQLEEEKVQAYRRSVVRDLHDGVAADLVGLVMQGRNLQQSPEDLLQRMEVAALIIKAQTGLEELRNVVWGLNQDARIGWDELVSRVHRKAIEMTQGMCSLKFEAQNTETPEVSLELALHLIRVVQEALRNSLHYAEPGCIGVALRADALLTVEIHDDGPGFPPGLTPTRGLRNLQERAIELGGQFEFWSDSGAHLRWSAPLCLASHSF